MADATNPHPEPKAVPKQRLAAPPLRANAKPREIETRPTVADPLHRLQPIFLLFLAGFMLLNLVLLAMLLAQSGSQKKEIQQLNEQTVQLQRGQQYSQEQLAKVAL